MRWRVSLPPSARIHEINSHPPHVPELFVPPRQPDLGLKRTRFTQYTIEGTIHERDGRIGIGVSATDRLGNDGVDNAGLQQVRGSELEGFRGLDLLVRVAPQNCRTAFGGYDAVD